MEKAGQLRTRVAPDHQSPLPRTTLTCVLGMVLSSCGGGARAAPVCWMNCCRLHWRSSLFSSSSS